MYPPVRVLGPQDLPVSLEELMDHCKALDHERPYVAGLVEAAVGWVEGYSGYLGRCLINQTWSQAFDRFPAGDIELRLGDLGSVASISYVNSDGVTQTFPSAHYVGLNVIPRPIVKCASGSRWPDTANVPAAVTVTFVAGYGADWNAVPGPIRQAITLMVSQWYEYRENVIVGTSFSELPQTVRALLAPFVASQYS